MNSLMALPQGFYQICGSEGGSFERDERLTWTKLQCFHLTSLDTLAQHGRQFFEIHMFFFLEKPASVQVVPASSASAAQSPVPVLPDDFFNQDGVKAAVEDEDINKGIFISENLAHQGVELWLLWGNIAFTIFQNSLH